MEDFAFTEFEKMCSSLGEFEWSAEFDKTDWVVTEKIHGANMSIHTDGENVRVARRRAFLKKDEHFFGHKAAEFMKTYPEKAKEIFKLVSEHIGDVDICQVTIYGELFGGRYVHKDLDVAPKKLKPVQQEIQYCPDVRFCAFDISYRSNVEDEKHVYIDYATSMAFFAQVGIFYAKPMFTGKVNECIHYELGFNSTIPTLLNLPSFGKGENKAEGIVVKPLREIVGKTKSNFEERVILKIKLPEFLECANTKESKTYSKGKQDFSSRPDKVLIPKLITLINTNRIVSGITKTGFPDNEAKKKELVEEVYQDVLFDAMATEDGVERLWNSCDEKQQKTIEKCLRAKILSGIKKHCDAVEERDANNS